MAIGMQQNGLKPRRMQKITPFLWFDDKAEEAANFYVSIFKNSRILAVNRWGRRRDVETGGG